MRAGRFEISIEIRKNRFVEIIALAKNSIYSSRASLFTQLVIY